VTSITNGAGTIITGTNSAGNTLTGAVTASFATSSVTLPTTTMDTLTVNVGASAPVDDYTVNLTGTDSSGNTATAQVEVDVTAGFTLAATPQSLTIPPGGSNTSSITVAAAGSESGQVSLSARIFGSDGEVEDGSVSVSFSPESLTIGGSTPSIATVNVGSTVAPGSTYTVWVYGQDAGGTKSGTPISLTVGTPSLKLRTNPTASVAAGGTSVIQSVLVKPSGGLQGSVSLSVSIVPSAGGSAPAGLSVAFSPASATIDANDDKLTFTASVSASSSVPVGTYVATITGTDGIVTGTATINITVSTMSLSVADHGYSPPGVDVGADVTDSFTATLSPSLAASGSVTYFWTAEPVWYSTNDATDSFAVDGTSDYTSNWGGGVLGGSDESWIASFNSVGFYVVEVTCTATVQIGNSVTVLTGNCFVGGEPSVVTSTGEGADALNAKADGISASADSAERSEKPIPVGAARTPYVIFVHGITQGNFKNNITRGLVIPAENDWTDEEKKAVSRTIGISNGMYSEFAWRGVIGFYDVVKNYPGGDPGLLATRIAGLYQKHKVVLVGHSAGGCMSVAASSTLAAGNNGPVAIIRLNSPPTTTPYCNVSCPVFDAMDPWDMCVMDYARWWVKDLACYGKGFTPPKSFPTLSGLNGGWNRLKTASKFDPPVGTAPIPYLTLAQLGVDAIISAPVSFGPSPIKVDFQNCKRAVNIHLDAMGADYWPQADAAWGVKIRSLLR
jgi:hypothetical protein